MDPIDELLAKLAKRNSDSQNHTFFLAEEPLAPAKSEFHNGKEFVKENDYKQQPIEKVQPTELEKSFIEKIRSLLTKASKEKFIFLLVGRSGVGKSSTINTLVGQNVAQVSKFVRGTKNAQSYEADISGICYVVVDTPGLADSSGKEQEYINSIKSEISEFHCMCFVTILGETRLRDDEAKAIKTISSAFGAEVWNRAIIIFTHADKISPDEYSEYLDERTKLIREEIAKYVDVAITEQIPSVAVVNDPKTGKSQPTPDGEPWIGKLYTAVFQKISKEGMLPFFLATANRLQDSSKHYYSSRKKSLSKNSQLNQGIETNPEPIPITPEQKKQVTEHITRNFNFGDAVALTGLGAAIGTAAGPVGTIIGGAIGAGIATLAWFFKS